MEQGQYLQKIAASKHFNIGYSDDDIVFVNNMKMLVEWTSAHLKSHLLILITEGRAQFMLAGKRMEVVKNQVVVLPPNILMTDFLFSPDFDFKAVFLTSCMLQNFLREKMGVWNEMMYVRHLHVLTVNEDCFLFFSHYNELLRLYMKANNGVPYKTEVIQGLLRSGILALCGRMKVLADYEPTDVRPAGESLLRRFLHILSSAEVKHRPVESYASELCISPKHLSAVCKRQSGKTASEWIAEHVMEDIRYYLKQTDLSLKEVSDRLNFPNPSFFGKYVKGHFGMTPIELRKS